METRVLISHTSHRDHYLLQAETALESVDWLNCLLKILWRNVYEPRFALQLCTVLQKKLSKSRPKFMVRRPYILTAKDV